MNLYLTKVTGRERVGLVPADSDSEEIIAKMGDGECAMFRLMRVRSVQMHRLYFGLCRKIGLNQEPQRNEHSIDSELRIAAGHYEVMEFEGFQVRCPKRIAFDQLTHDEWMSLWPSLERAIDERFGPEYLPQPGSLSP